MEYIVKYLLVIAWTALKFVLGPISSLTFGLSLPEGIILTVVGMMGAVVLVSSAGLPLRRRLLKWTNPGKRRIFSPRSRRMVRIWRRYGLKGVAFLTPLLLTPIGGTLVAVAFGAKKGPLWVAMLLSALFWSVVINVLVFQAGTLLGLEMESQIAANLRPAGALQ